MSCFRKLQHFTALSTNALMAFREGIGDILDYESTGATIMAARKFIPQFEEKIGSVLCPKIQEDMIFGRYMDPAASEENMEAFALVKGFEKCGLPPGIGARLAAEVIIESLE